MYISEKYNLGKMNKVDKYLKRFTNDIEYSARSRYYKLPCGIVRVSDHIGRNSNAMLSIIITDDDEYVLHEHSNGKLKPITYKNLKKLILSFATCGSLFTNQANMQMIVDLKSDIKNKKSHIDTLKKENESLVSKNELLTSRNKTFSVGNDFMTSYNLFRKLTHNQKIAVCTLYEKTGLEDFKPHELMSAMESPMVKTFLSK